jgi:hypothetical protein
MTLRPWSSDLQPREGSSIELVVASTVGHRLGFRPSSPLTETTPNDLDESILRASQRDRAIRLELNWT